MKRLTPNDLAEAAALLGHGEVVGIPTDTVYGIGCRLESTDGVARLFALKDRPGDVALPVLVASVEMAVELVGEVAPSQRALLTRWWPGAVTFVVPCEPELAARVGSTTASIGLRCPDDALTRSLLSTVGPMAVTSANLHGAPPATSADELLDAFAQTSGIAAVLDGGPRAGASSTVVSLDEAGRLTVLRDGPIDRRDLEASIEEISRG